MQDTDQPIDGLTTHITVEEFKFKGQFQHLWVYISGIFSFIPALEVPFLNAQVVHIWHHSLSRRWR